MANEERITREQKNEKKQKDIFKTERREKNKKTFKKLFKFTTVFLILFYVFFLYTSNISTASFIVNEERIINTQIPDSFNGVKIIQFSDLHYGSNIDEDKLKKIIKLINDREPDLVLFTGDLIAKDYDITADEQEILIKQLKKIEVSLGKYTVAGDEDNDTFVTIMNQSDFTILDNEHELLYNNTNDPILLSGFSSSLNNNLDVAKTLSDVNSENNYYSIAMFHEPDSTDNILDNYNFNLLLAGHSHNGNIRIPYFGSILKRDGARKYDQAYYEIDDSKLYISSGLGTDGDGIRLFCKPSINFFRISNF